MTTRWKAGKANPQYRHGHALKGRQSPEYRVWCHMIARCSNPKDKKFGRYGGRGITVSERWFDFESFLQDMGKRPKNTTLGRIDNNGPYNAANCEWQNHSKQQNNRSNTIRIRYRGRTFTLREAAEEAAISYD